MFTRRFVLGVQQRRQVVFGCGSHHGGSSMIHSSCPSSAVEQTRGIKEQLKNAMPASILNNRIAGAEMKIKKNLREIGWTCSVCKTQYKTEYKYCTKCQIEFVHGSDPEKLRIKPGRNQLPFVPAWKKKERASWTCFQCHSVNLSLSARCFRCHLSREESDDANALSGGDGAGGSSSRSGSGGSVASSASKQQVVSGQRARLSTSRQTLWTPLHLAAHAGKVDAVRQILETKIGRRDLDSAGPDFWSPLHVAARYGRFEIVKLLVSVGAKRELFTSEKLTPLHIAVQFEHLSTVKWMLRKEMSVDAVEADGWTPLHYACQNGHLAMAELLLDNGAKAGAETFHGERPLHFAARSGNLGLVQALIDAGANPTVLTQNGWSPLHAACQAGHKNIVEFLKKEHGDEVSFFAATKSRLTPVAIAAKYGHLDLVKFLLNEALQVVAASRASVGILERGDDEHLEVKDASLAQQLNLTGGNPDLVLFTSNNEDGQANGSNSSGDAHVPLLVAACMSPTTSSPCVLEYLLDQLEKPELRRDGKIPPLNRLIHCQDPVTGMTPLTTVAKIGNLDLLKFLLLDRAEGGAGADPRDRSAELLSPLHYAASSSSPRSPAVLDHLLKSIVVSQGKSSGKKKSAQLASKQEYLREATPKGSTALHFACQRGSLESAKILIHHADDDQTSAALVNMKNQNGIGPLHLAAGQRTKLKTRTNGSVAIQREQQKYLQLLKILLQAGANVDEKSLKGWTPLFYAVGATRNAGVRFLLEQGADGRVETEENQTAYELAKSTEGVSFASETLTKETVDTLRLALRTHPAVPNVEEIEEDFGDLGGVDL